VGRLIFLVKVIYWTSEQFPNSLWLWSLLVRMDWVGEKKNGWCSIVSRMMSLGGLNPFLTILVLCTPYYYRPWTRAKARIQGSIITTHRGYFPYKNKLFPFGIDDAHDRIALFWSTCASSPPSRLLQKNQHLFLKQNDKVVQETQSESLVVSCHEGTASCRCGLQRTTHRLLRLC
jgi:hypothetical protein